MQARSTMAFKTPECCCEAPLSSSSSPEILYNQPDVCTMSSLLPAVSLFILPAAFTLPVNIVLIILREIWRARTISLCLSLSFTFLWRPSFPFFLTSQVPGGDGPSLWQFLSYYVSPLRAGEQAYSVLTQPLRLEKLPFVNCGVCTWSLSLQLRGASGAPDRHHPGVLLDFLCDVCWQWWPTLQRLLMLLSKPPLSNSTFFFTSLRATYIGSQL